MVAVVDDNQSLREAFARMLRASEFDVAVFGSGGEFLESLKSASPDCVVLDMQMPDISGLDVQHALTRSNAHLPVIVVTAFDRVALRESCLKVGATAYLSKPVRRDVLVGAINDALRLRHDPHH